MDADELEALIAELESGLQEEVQAALTLTSREFAEAVSGSTELVAAAFSVSRIGSMWRRRVGGLMAAIRRIGRRGAEVTAEDLGEPVPSGLEEALSGYYDAVRVQLDDVGDRLSEAAVQALSEGVSAGESQEELQARLLDVFSDTGSQLGPVRAERIAMTQATSAFNAGTLETARALTGDERPLVKQWVTRRDARVRVQHADTDGQIQFLDDPFDVAGTPMQFPGDPSAPADLVIGCRCILRTATASATASATPDAGTVAELQSRMPEQLKDYWLRGEGAARIRWGTPGSFDRCVRELRDEFPENTEGLCANLYHEATGRWPGENKSGADVHTGAMIALIPDAESAARLALSGGEDVEQLHVTLAYLGKAADWADGSRNGVRRSVQRIASSATPVAATAFGFALWNPGSDDPVWVYNVGDDLDDPSDTLVTVHEQVWLGLTDEGLEPPRQFSPWAPHIAATYGNLDGAGQLIDGLGPVRFDRIRVAFAGEYTDYPLNGEPDERNDVEESETEDPGTPTTAPWHTPGSTGLAFENQQTGDGRVFAAGALYWDGDGPWPLQYADEMQGGHEGAQLAGAIGRMDRDGDRVDSGGVLYLTQQTGYEAALLLSQNAPLGVSVDLDDVDLEMTSTAPDAVERYKARLMTASVLPTEDGGWMLTGRTEAEVTASGTGVAVSSRNVSFTIDSNGIVSGGVLDLVAAAGDPDTPDSVVLDAQKSGDFLVRITRGRVRGATLVSIPAFADARIVLKDPSMFASGYTDEEVTAAVKSTTDYDRVLRHVRSSRVPVGAARVAQLLKMPVVAAQRILSTAASRGEVVRLTRGLYTDKTTSARADHVMMDDMVASVTGKVSLPVADRDHPWDGEAAEGRVFEWADGDTGKLDQAFLWRDDEADPATQASRKIGVADIIDGRLTLVPKGVSAALAAVNGARGGVDIPADELNDVRARLEEMRAHVSEATGDDAMQASAWKAMQSMPAMPAEWFREPTVEELPPGGPGVNYSNGRIFGWVAQAGEPHAGFAKKITIDTLGRIDTTHFLRQTFHLDDGTTVKAGAYTMNVGHHRDGAECETSACQFDDTRTVAGIVTVGMNERGMWFSGAAAPWLSEWDRQVFAATQPSYHLRKSGTGWQLRAVLGVPVPGHSSPLLASAVIERSQMALTAAATMADVEEVIAAEEERQEAAQAAEVLTAAIDYDKLADALVAAQARADERKAAEAAELAELLAMAEELGASVGSDDPGKLDDNTTGTAEGM